MASSAYPAGTVRALLATDLVTEATRTALQARLDAPDYEPQFFDAATYELLRMVAARLFPQPDRDSPIELAPAIDQRLLTGGSDGWRYDVLPPDREAYRLGLGGIRESARVIFGAPFEELTGLQQDAVLQAVQNETAPGPLWDTLSANRFFEELLAELTENYYAHPLAQEEIGYVGMADVPGWSKITLNQKEDREPAVNE
ncbi:gluconate 2-dehydrogenase subunit 3 family protein [Hymenobacter cellulosivorans]|uniref:Gluconate 2-dehydrogenase subunit 3 family protein n=1 Tax=Hymenobacter cellulosivorans TaxID=2932249 RepID=A0ABY4FB44_9BACT|nr:gluconate 2-dehydrogenase subunit 3 family protein [Hymenobacter cellulosivorans]UOQ53887.1 gluconate 2-dehydrogenase subunit 3 family protein [Hymenobacter cellulosivorans]